jgi:hypothetical protein
MALKEKVETVVLTDAESESVVEIIQTTDHASNEEKQVRLQDLRERASHITFE